jgi:hypothetical protein
MFELHVVVASVVMFNILELIMEIVPNYPTPLSRQRRPPLWDPEVRGRGGGEGGGFAEFTMAARGVADEHPESPLRRRRRADQKGSGRVPRLGSSGSRLERL